MLRKYISEQRISNNNYKNRMNKFLKIFFFFIFLILKFVLTYSAYLEFKK